MNDLRASDRDVDRAIRSWLHEDRHEDVSRVAGAVLDQLEATSQRRAMWWPAWRTSTMNKIVGFGVAVAAVFAVVLVGSQVIGSPTSGGAGAGPTPTATTEPSPSPPASAPPPTQSYTSTVHGVTVSHPAGWTAEPATEPWTSGPNNHSIGDPQDDRLFHPTLTDHLFLGISSQPIGDSTAQDWITEQMAEWADVEGCAATAPIAVDGATGRIGGEGCDLAVVTTDGRGYWISLRRSMDDPPAVAPYDRAWFEDVLDTVQLYPEDAVD